MMKRVALFGILAMMGLAPRASALIITSQGNVLPGGGSCLATNVTTTGSGATFNCTGIVLTGHTKVYLGIRNTVSPNGNNMLNADPAASSPAVFRSSSTAASSITYTSTTSVNQQVPSAATLAVTNTLNLTRTAGSGTVVATGGNPANSPANGDIGFLFQITAAGTFTLDVDILAQDSSFGLGQACPAVYDPSHVNVAGGDHSRVDMQFYWSDCGDGQTDSPEQCDDGGANGSAGSCCTTSCTFKTVGTACTDDGNVCTNDQCTGASNICSHPNNTASCTDGLFCNGTDTCSGGSCVVHSGDPCPGADGDGNCSESCNEASDNCTAPDPNGSSCTDGLFCDGTETCTGGVCGSSTGDPCSGPDGDGNCAESCDEATDTCTAPDPDGSSCTDGLFCDGTETCSSGVCGNSTGDPCPGPDGDGNCSESCNEAGNNCTAPDPNGSSCTDGLFCNGADTCNAGACTTHAGDPCPGPDGDNDCSESCNEAGNNCLGNDPDGSSCSDGLFCNGADTCNSGSCTAHAGDPCTGPDGDTDCSESCDEGADNCLGADPDGTSCPPAVGACDLAETCSSGACPSDSVKPVNTLCNAGSGDSCDPDEVCDGVGTTCPPDVVAPSGTVCNAGSGDSCDPDETCSGTAGQPCPSDTITPSGTVCRTGSGDVCDPDETCTGTADQPCPPDVVQPASFVCNAGSGDLCDPDSLCPGVAAGTCAADVVAPAGTVCNPGSGDLCDPDETCSGNPDQACPSDTVASSSTVCRSAAGVCDAVENCTGVANQACPADAKEPNTTPCRPSTGSCAPMRWPKTW
jgi:hypothetical protein